MESNGDVEECDLVRGILIDLFSRQVLSCRCDWRDRQGLQPFPICRRI